MPDMMSCPFCGGEAEVLATVIPGSTAQIVLSSKVVVMCRKCGATSCSFTSHYGFNEDGCLVCVENGRDKAVDAWNRRANDGQRVDEG